MTYLKANMGLTQSILGDVINLAQTTYYDFEEKFLLAKISIKFCSATILITNQEVTQHW